MASSRSRLLLSLVALSGLSVTALVPVTAQTPIPAHPALAGVWTPVDPPPPKAPVLDDARRAQMLNNAFWTGATQISQDATVTIDQKPDRITVTIDVPQATLDKFMGDRGRGRFYPVMIYRPNRSGGLGAAGLGALDSPTWVGDTLVVPDAVPGSNKPLRVTYALKDHLLEVTSENTVYLNPVKQLLKRVR